MSDGDFYGNGAFERFQADDNFGLVSAAEIARRGIIPVSWDIESLIETANGPLLLTAAPERFKSWLALLICHAMVAGRPLFGHFRVARTRPYAIYVNLDAGRVATENRIARLGSELPPNFFVTTWYEWNAQRFANLLEAFPGAFVVVDCFANIHQLGETRIDPAEALRIVLQELRVLYERYDCNGIVIDHSARADREDDENFSGHQQKKATTRQGITLQRAKRDRDEEPADRQIVHVGCLKMSEAEKFPPFEVEISFVEGLLATRFLGFIGSREQRRQQRLDADVSLVASALRSGALSRKDVIERTGLARDRAFAALQAEQFERTGSGPSTRYALIERDSETERELRV